MKIKNKKNKLTYIVLATVLTLTIIGTAYTLTQQSREKNPTTHQSSTDSSKRQSVNSNSSSTNTQKTTTNTDQPAPTQLDKTSGKKVAQIVSSVEVLNNVVYIRGGINNAVLNDGSCYASLVGPNSQTIRLDTTLLQNATTTDCKTISIDTNELVKGQWSFTLNYTSDIMKGQSNAITFEIK